MSHTLEQIQAMLTSTRTQLRIIDCDRDMMLKRGRELTIAYMRMGTTDLKNVELPMTPDGKVDFSSKNLSSGLQRLKDITAEKNAIDNQMRKLIKREIRISGDNITYLNCVDILTSEHNPLDYWGDTMGKRELKRILRLIGSGYTPTWASKKWGVLV